MMIFYIGSVKELIMVYLRASVPSDWDGFRDHLRDVPWLDAIYAAKDITEWVEISIDCHIPQLKPHSLTWFIPVPLPLDIATIISIRTMECDS